MRRDRHVALLGGHAASRLALRLDRRRLGSLRLDGLRSGGGAGGGCGDSRPADRTLVDSRQAQRARRPPSAARRESQMPAITSVKAISVSRKNVECANCGSSRNSAAAAANTTNDSRWSVTYFAPGRADFTTSSNSRNRPNASSTSLNVIVHDCSEGRTDGDDRLLQPVEPQPHQEDDDVDDRQRDQEQRETDHRHRLALPQRSSRIA